MTVKEHYDNHLANFYSWMTGDFDNKKQEFKKFLVNKGIRPQTNKLAIDFGAGHGLQSIPLAELGFHVVAVGINGKLILSFRDYTFALRDTARFIPVKSDETKILTCIPDYEDEFVNVTDLLYEKTSDGWKQKVSSYKKVRIVTSEILKMLEASNFKIEYNDAVNRMTTIIATKIDS